MKRILLIVLIFLNGCDDYKSDHAEMCNVEPESMFCKNSPSIGDLRPTKKYSLELAYELSINTEYKVTDRWYYNDTVYEILVGDCEDIAMTIVKHMVDDGINKKYLSLAYIEYSSNVSHVFVAVDTEEHGMIHIDHYLSGDPIEPLTEHMRMTDVGAYRWIAGDIK